MTRNLLHKAACWLPGLALGLLLPVSAPALPIVIDYNDPANYGFNDNTAVGDTTLGELRREAFEYAVEILAARLDGSIDVTVEANFANLGGSPTAATLAVAGPRWYLLIPSGGPVANIRYPGALANQIEDEVVTPLAELEVTFNNDIDGDTVLGTVHFYYGLDEEVGSDISFVRVALHELSHGLGFVDTIDDDDGSFLLPGPTIFEHFLREGTTGGGDPLIPMSDSERLDAIQSENLFWADSTSVSAAHGSQAPMYAPDPVAPGSSVAHFDAGAFSEEELMEPSITSDRITLGLTDNLFEDIGYGILGPGEYPKAEFTTAPATISSNDGPQDFTVTLTSATDQDVTFSLNISGSAEEGVHYTISATDFTITSPANSATFTVEALSQETAGSESLVIGLQRIVNAEFGAPVSAGVTLQLEETTSVDNWMVY